MKRTRKKKQSRFGLGLSLFVILLLVLGPCAILAYQSKKSGMSWGQLVEKLILRSAPPQLTLPNNSLPKGETVEFLTPRPIGDSFTTPPKISHVSAVDLDQDGLLDVLVCDCESNQVSWIRQRPLGEFTETVLATNFVAPAHAEAVDFDKDGDLDILLAVLGMLFPNNDRIGSIVILENAGNMSYQQHVVLENTARVSDVQPADLDGDGDMDLAVTQFGYDDGETRWVENLGEWRFKDHLLQSLSGGIHCPVADLNSDGRLDIAVLISQESEEIYVFAGDGAGGFTPHRVYGADNPDFGSSSLALHDLDQDGDVDMLYTNGDAFDYLPPSPRPWHGVQWLENRGSLVFEPHRIIDFGGVVRAQPVDVDHDGDLDLLAASAFNDWKNPSAQSLMWLENAGEMRFRPHDLATAPSHLQTIAIGDFNQDGEPDAVTGGMHVYAPYDRMDRVVLWQNNGDAAAGAASASK